MKNRRTRKLIDPRLQLNLLLIVFGAAGIGVALQAGLTSIRLRQLAEHLPEDGPVVLGSLREILTWSALHALGFAVPIVGLLAFTATFRLAGPLYRMREFLKAVLRGEHPQPCTLRRYDELHELCELLNQVTAEARARHGSPEPSAEVREPAASEPGAPLPADATSAAETTDAA